VKTATIWSTCPAFVQTAITDAVAHRAQQSILNIERANDLARITEALQWLAMIQKQEVNL